MYEPFYKDIRSTARKTFPGLSELSDVSWEHLISPLELTLPASIYKQAEDAIQAFYRVSREDAFSNSLTPISKITDRRPKNRSVLMAYDFHTTEDGSCALVEINTNAAGFMFTTLLNAVKSGTKLLELPMTEALFASFKKELQLIHSDPPTKPRVAIVDEQIVAQKMYPEFLMYRDWFRSYGWQADLVEAEELGDADVIYNRSTDFYFESEASERLLNAYLNGTTCISPNPYEYWLLADKERLIQFGDDSFWAKFPHSSKDRDAVKQVLIPTFEKSAFVDEQEIWDKRRGLFFKPKRAFGGKSVYRGESVSRKVFERLMGEDILVQNFQPAQRFPTDDPRSVLNNWKFDLRFYVYEDQIQGAVARSYQGQVTNFASEYGGFTFVQF